MLSLLAQAIFKSIAQIISSSLALLLQSFKKNNGEEKYNHLIGLFTEAFALLKDDVKKTKTKIDDTALEIFTNAIDQAG